MLRANGKAVVPDGNGGLKLDNVYENGDADSRVGTDKVSRFRPKYRKLKPDEVEHHNEIKDLASKLEFAIEKLPRSRERSMAITKLEESIMWAIKGLTA